MKSRERLRQVLAREPVDRIPTQVNYTSAMGDKLAAYLHISADELPARLGNHLRRVDVPKARRTSADGKVYFDAWGVGWSTETEGYWPVVHPLAENQDLDSYFWPDPTEPGLLDEAQQAIAADGGEHFIVPNIGFCLYERAWSLRGFENLNMDLALDPGFVGELLDRIIEIQIALARRFVAAGVDGGYCGDDYGAQNGMLFSPGTWRELFKPRLARLFAVFREADLQMILHSDGDIKEILPDLLEIGLTVLNPVQPEVLDLDWLARAYGERLAFYGGVSTQTVLPFGSPAEVRAAAERAVGLLARDGTGLLLAPSHRLTADIPIENVEALLEYIATS